MATFLELQDEVASACLFKDRAIETDVAPQIRRAINRAIQSHSADRFWFNEVRWKQDTEVGIEFYPVPEDYVSMFMISLDVPRRMLQSQINDTIESWPPRPGRPEHYALFGAQYRLHPIPDAAYRMRLWGTRRYPDLVADDDANPWTIHAEELVIEAAKERVYYGVLHDIEKATVAGGAAQTRRQALFLETQKRQPTKPVRIWL